MAKTQLQKYRDRETVRKNALYGDDNPPDYSREATRRRVLYGDGQKPEYRDIAEIRRRIMEGDHT